jgi:DNA-binding transcriptional MerR regulator
VTELSIGEVARRTGLSIHTLRMYEREGLLTSSLERDSGGRRVYSDADVQWLTTCRVFRSSGMPIAVIARFAELVREGPGNEIERLALLREHEERMRARAAEIAAARELITGKVAAYEQHLAKGTAASLWT